MPKKWTSKTAQPIVDALQSGRYPTVTAAAMSVGMTRPQLANALQCAGLLPATSYLVKPDVKPEDLLEQRQSERLLVENKATIKSLTDQLQEARIRQRYLDQLDKPIPEIVIKPKERGKCREATAFAMASDWHCEELVDPRLVADVNAFNLEIADARIRRFFQGIAAQIAHHRSGPFGIKIRELVVWFGGDLMSGHIHEELVQNNQLSPVQAVAWIQARIVGGIKMLLGDPDLRITILWNVGNHGRTGKKLTRGAAVANSFEWLIGSNVREHFANEQRIAWQISPGEHCYLDVYDLKIHTTHGYQVKYAKGVGGPLVPGLRQCNLWDTHPRRKADIHVIGHHHTWLDHRNLMINGSLIGVSPFGYDYGYQPPQQGFFLIDSRRGKCQVTPLWVDE